MGLIIVCVLLWVVLAAVVPLLTLAMVAAVSPLTTRLATPRQRRRVAPILNTSAPITGYASDWTPPVRLRDLARLLLISLPLGPFAFAAPIFLLFRWHSPRDVFATDDGQLWVTRPKSKLFPSRGKVLVSQGTQDSWLTTHAGRFGVVGVIAGEELGLLPGPTTSRLAKQTAG